MKSRHLTIRKCRRLLKIEIRNLKFLREFGGPKTWRSVNGLGGRHVGPAMLCQHSIWSAPHALLPPRTPPHSYGAPGDRSEKAGCSVLAVWRQSSSFLFSGLGLGEGLSRIFKVRLSVRPGKWKCLVPAEERPLSGWIASLRRPQHPSRLAALSSHSRAFWGVHSGSKVRVSWSVCSPTQRLLQCRVRLN